MVEIIYNPVSGKKGKTKELAEAFARLAEKEGFSCNIHPSERPGHATDLARQAAQKGAEAVAAVGGDGTVSEVACGLVHTSCPLLIIPSGTGNDFCKSADIPLDPMKAAALFFTGRPVPVDMGQINDRYFINEVGAGLDVDVLRNSLKYKKKLHGLLPYLLGVFEAVAKYRTFPLTIKSESGLERTEDATVFSAANGGFIGGGIRISPQASICDGSLDFTVVKRLSKGRLLPRLVGLLRGKVLGFPETVHDKGCACTISSRNMYVNIDGDIVQMDLAVIHLVPNALLLYRPPVFNTPKGA